MGSIRTLGIGLGQQEILVYKMSGKSLAFLVTHYPRQQNGAPRHQNGVPGLQCTGKMKNQI